MNKDTQVTAIFAESESAARAVSALIQGGVARDDIGWLGSAAAWQGS